MSDFYRVGPALARRHQVALVAFDVLWLDGEPLVDQPQSERRALLDQLPLMLLGVPVMPAFPVEDALALCAACAPLGADGVVR